MCKYRNITTGCQMIFMSIVEICNHFQYKSIPRLIRNCHAHYLIFQPNKHISHWKIFIYNYFIYICTIQSILKLLLNPHSMFQVCIAAWDKNKYHFYLFCCIACKTVRKVAVFMKKLYLIYNEKSLNNWTITCWNQCCILVLFSLQVTFLSDSANVSVEYVLCQYCGCWWAGAMAPGHQQKQY